MRRLLDSDPRGFLSSAFRVLRALVRIRKNLKATA